VIGEVILVRERYTDGLGSNYTKKGRRYTAREIYRTVKALEAQQIPLSRI
jgi:hypothetical protein